MLSIFSKISGPKREILKYLERYEKSWVAEELLTINKIFSIFEVLLNIALIISGIILTIFAFFEWGFLEFLLMFVGTFIAECLYLFLIRLRRLRFFVKIENIILLEEIKLALTHKKEQETEEI